MLCFVFDYGTISMTLNVGELFILKTLRITFCILACISVAAVVPVGIFFDWYCLLPVVGDSGDLTGILQLGFHLGLMLGGFLFRGKALFGIGFFCAVRGLILNVHIVNSTGPSSQHTVAVAFVLYLPG